MGYETENIPMHKSCGNVVPRVSCLVEGFLNCMNKCQHDCEHLVGLKEAGKLNPNIIRHLDGSDATFGNVDRNVLTRRT
ncbi:hypothetical protein TNCV_4829401 [Trichonephila clavipes]|nr:hypothetical protein TNCV_4829401 [Trichonephila clavipes]